MKRVRIDLEEIAARENLVLAFYKAAKGKRSGNDVADFCEGLDGNLKQLGDDILGEELPYGRFRRFYVFDPKKRLIHAGCFQDRVFNHALMNLAGPVLEQAMSPSSFACRPGMGVHRAVACVQRNLQRYSWYCKVDVKNYFASIAHCLAQQALLRRFKGKDFERQLHRILNCYQSEPGKGLPIGSLTSQYFANYYLDSLDRKLHQNPRVRSFVRYMDDIVFWGDSRREVKAVLVEVKAYLRDKLHLLLKSSTQLQQSSQGITFCGFRVSQGAVRLGRRKKKRYLQRRQYWEELYLSGKIDESQLQIAYAAVHAITSGTDSLSWRQQNLHRHPSLPV